VIYELIEFEIKPHMTFYLG